MVFPFLTPVYRVTALGHTPGCSGQVRTPDPTCGKLGMLGKPRSPAEFPDPGTRGAGRSGRCGPRGSGGMELSEGTLRSVTASRGCPGAWRACTCPAGLRRVGSTDPAVGPAAPQVNSGRPGAQGADAERGEGLGGNSRGGRRGRECGFTLTGNPAPRGAASPRGRARAPWTGRPSRPGLARPVPRGQSGTPGRLGSGRGEPLHADRFPRGHRTGRHPRRRPKVPVGPPVSPPSLVASPRGAARPLRAAARTPRPQEWRTRSPAGGKAACGFV